MSPHFIFYKLFIYEDVFILILGELERSVLGDSQIPVLQGAVKYMVGEGIETKYLSAHRRSKQTCPKVDYTGCAF